MTDETKVASPEEVAAAEEHMNSYKNSLFEHCNLPIVNALIRLWGNEAAGKIPVCDFAMATASMMANLYLAMERMQPNENAGATVVHDIIHASSVIVRNRTLAMKGQTEAVDSAGNVVPTHEGSTSLN